MTDTKQKTLTPITKKKIPCPECGSKWLRFAKKAGALECRKCNCLFNIEEDGIKIVQHGATYTGNTKDKPVASTVD